MNIKIGTVYFLRILLILSTIYLILKQDYPFAFISMVATLLAFAPVLINWKYKVNLPWSIEFLIAFILYMHIFGAALDLYDKIYLWSPLMHFLLTALTALLAFIIVYTLNLTKQVKISNFMIGFFTVIFSLAIGALWEILEFAIDSNLGTHLQSDFGLPAIVDTMWDLIWDGIAGIFVALIGTSLVKGYHELVHPFEMLIKKIFKKSKEKIRKITKPDKIKKAEKD